MTKTTWFDDNVDYAHVENVAEWQLRAYYIYIFLDEFNAIEFI